VAVALRPRLGRVARAGALLALGAALAGALPGRASGAGPSRALWECAPERGVAWLPEHARVADPGNGGLGRLLYQRSDFAHGALYLGAYLGLDLGAEPPDSPRWASSAAFEDDARSALAAGSESGRDAAATASDVLLYLGAAAPAWLDSGAGSWLRRGDCAGALEMLGETAEALGLTLLVTEATKLLAARERPFQSECALDPGYNSDCFRADSRKSFFSGHASLAAAGAGLLCRNTYRRAEPVWGRLGAIRNPIPCALGAGAAVATGLLRIRADEHWLGDVLAGWALGAAIGLFDLPGPFDLLHFRYGSAGRRADAVLLPSVGAGRVGARLQLRF
jgi:membrane-associated phospholipid phosphatase